MLFTAAPITVNGVTGIDNDRNGAVYDRFQTIRAARLSSLLCAEDAGLWRVSSSDHANAMNDGDNNNNIAW